MILLDSVFALYHVESGEVNPIRTSFLTTLKKYNQSGQVRAHRDKSKVFASVGSK